MPITTPGYWRVGNHGSVVADCPVVAGGKSIEDCRACKDGGHEFYGGHLVCESIFREGDAHLIAAAPQMIKLICRALRSATLSDANRQLVDNLLMAWQPKERVN